MKSASRLGVVGAAAAALLLLPVAAASAHVTVTPSSTVAGQYTLLTFSNGHGCEGSPTTEIAIQIPDGIFAVTPTIKPGWTIDKVMKTLDTPVDDGHGGQYTERVDQVVYTADAPQPDGYREAFDLQLKLPETVGEQLNFPVVQTCETGETAWIEIAVEGQPEPDAPAPALVLTAAGAEAAGHTAAETPTPISAVDDSTDSSNVLGWVGVGLGALGLIAGAAAFVRVSKNTKPVA